MNPLIVTIVIALGTFILAIFGASWLNQQAMNKRIDDLKTYLDARFEAVDARFEAVDARFDAVEQRIANLEIRLDQRIGSLENRIERIERQLDQIFKPSLPRT